MISTVLYCTAIYCTVLYCNALYCIIFYGNTLYCNCNCKVMFGIELYFNIHVNTSIQWTALHWNALHCSLLTCILLHCNVQNCIVLQKSIKVNRRLPLDPLAGSWHFILAIRNRMLPPILGIQCFLLYFCYYAMKAIYIFILDIMSRP